MTLPYTPDSEADIDGPLGACEEDVFVFPASFAQQRLWFLDQLEPGSALYNIPAVVIMRGRLDVTALGRALGEVVRRHESLRTTFAVVEEQPVQVVAPSPAPGLQLSDLSALSAHEREAEARRLSEDEARSPFDLTDGPLLRARLLRLSAEEHQLLLTLHHIVSDGWSLRVLARELAALYGAYSAGRPSPLPELTLQYSDYAVWQREWLQGEVLEAHLSYWRGQLEGAPPVLELPTDKPRPAVQSFRGATHAFALPAGLRGRLEALAQQEGATLFMTLLAAWQVLLSRYTGQEDIS